MMCFVNLRLICALRCTATPVVVDHGASDRLGGMATSSRTTLSYVLTVGALVAVAGVSEAGESEGRSRPANSR